MIERNEKGQFVKGCIPHNFIDGKCFGKEYQYRWREENIERFREYQRDYKKLNYTINNKIKISARNKAREIKIPDGQKCEICEQSLAIEKHHRDYTKPLEVNFLCKKCHTGVQN